MKVRIKRIDGELPLPSYAKDGDAGLDLRLTKDISINPGETVIVGCGFAFEIPTGHYGMLAPRSGMAAKQGITLANSPSVIDSKYRGEVGLALRNIGKKPCHIIRGTRVAQMILMSYKTCEFIEVDELDKTERGASGFGSSGVA